jgi:hypothetical protein
MRKFGEITLFFRNDRVVIRPASHNTRGVLFNGDRLYELDSKQLSRNSLKAALLESYEYLQEYTEDEAYARRDNHPVDDGVAIALGSESWKALAKSRDCIMFSFGRGPKNIGGFGLEFPDHRKSHGITTTLADQKLGLDLKVMEHPTDDELVDRAWEYMPLVRERMAEYLLSQQK